MKNKSMILSLLFVGVIAVPTSIAIFNNSPISLFRVANADGYEINFSSTSNTLNSNKNEAILKTKKDNDVKFEYSGYSKNGDYWGALSNDGYIENPTINNVSSNPDGLVPYNKLSNIISISYSIAGNGQLALYTGYSSYSPTQIEYIDGEGIITFDEPFSYSDDEDSSDYNFEHIECYMPSYFKLVNETGSTVVINSFSVAYKCGESSPAYTSPILLDSDLSDAFILTPGEYGYSLTSNNLADKFEAYYENENGKAPSKLAGEELVPLALPSVYDGVAITNISPRDDNNSGFFEENYLNIELYMPDFLLFIGERAFEECSFSSIQFNPELRLIDNFAFHNATVYTYLNMKDGFDPSTAVNSAFFRLILPDSLMMLGNYAFFDFTNYYYYMEDDSFKLTLGSYSKRGYVYMYVGSGLYNAGDYAFAAANLIDVYVSPSNKVYTSLYENEMATNDYLSIAVALYFNNSTDSDLKHTHCIVKRGSPNTTLVQASVMTTVIPTVDVIESFAFYYLDTSLYDTFVPLHPKFVGNLGKISNVKSLAFTECKYGIDYDIQLNARIYGGESLLWTKMYEMSEGKAPSFVDGVFTYFNEYDHEDAVRGRFFDPDHIEILSPNFGLYHSVFAECTFGSLYLQGAIFSDYVLGNCVSLRENPVDGDGETISYNSPLERENISLVMSLGFTKDNSAENEKIATNFFTKDPGTVGFLSPYSCFNSGHVSFYFDTYSGLWALGEMISISSGIVDEKVFEMFNVNLFYSYDNSELKDAFLNNHDYHNPFSFYNPWRDDVLSTNLPSDYDSSLNSWNFNSYSGTLYNDLAYGGGEDDNYYQNTLSMLIFNSPFCDSAKDTSMCPRIDDDSQIGYHYEQDLFVEDFLIALASAFGNNLENVNNYLYENQNYMDLLDDYLTDGVFDLLG